MGTSPPHVPLAIIHKCVTPLLSEESFCLYKPTLVVIVQTVLSPIFSRALRSGIDYLYEVSFVLVVGFEPTVLSTY